MPWSGAGMLFCFSACGIMQAGMALRQPCRAGQVGRRSGSHTGKARSGGNNGKAGAGDAQAVTLETQGRAALRQQHWKGQVRRRSGSNTGKARLGGAQAATLERPGWVALRQQHWKGQVGWRSGGNTGKAGAGGVQAVTLELQGRSGLTALLHRLRGRGETRTGR
eukprot:362191-Chlamydomonas_euryale.AAC.4